MLDERTKERVLVNAGPHKYGAPKVLGAVLAEEQVYFRKNAWVVTETFELK